MDRWTNVKSIGRCARYLMMPVTECGNGKQFYNDSPSIGGRYVWGTEQIVLQFYYGCVRLLRVSFPIQLPSNNIKVQVSTCGFNIYILKLEIYESNIELAIFRKTIVC